MMKLNKYCTQSYFCSIYQDIFHFQFQLDVKEAKVIEDHPQWDISDDEEEKEYNDNISEDSDYSTDEYDTE